MADVLRFQNNLNREERSRQDFAQAANPELRVISNEMPFSRVFLGAKTGSLYHERGGGKLQFRKVTQ
ncbi:hypothetical protein SAPIO_CDS5276 [Scedosporium apiospermum]|uniref:Uncharacterized protein n=1 Tax=Pseudallescheria apiosperma TaxID=563466 RepID=A0A084G687_PSEDA|nr:uncharacterized protein SAPIO_CDS5276 [Scedosporium apiospermum]KEZ42849.1 hypothetical protein SAPIO_CDS5276 [Scedosporium apiospermum]